MMNLQQAINKLIDYYGLLNGRQAFSMLRWAFEDLECEDEMPQSLDAVVEHLTECFYSPEFDTEDLFKA